MIEQILQLYNSNNVELAYELAKSQGLDLCDLIKVKSCKREYSDLEINTLWNNQMSWGRKTTGLQIDGGISFRRMYIENFEKQNEEQVKQFTKINEYRVKNESLIKSSTTFRDYIETDIPSFKEMEKWFENYLNSNKW